MSEKSLFDELCELKERIDRAATTIGNKNRSISSIDVSRLSREKRQWIYDDTAIIRKAVDELSDACGFIEYLKVRLRTIAEESLTL